MTDHQWDKVFTLAIFDAFFIGMVVWVVKWVGSGGKMEFALFVGFLVVLGRARLIYGMTSSWLFQEYERGVREGRERAFQKD